MASHNTFFFGSVMEDILQQVDQSKLPIFLHLVGIYPQLPVTYQLAAESLCADFTSVFEISAALEAIGYYMLADTVRSLS